MLFDTNFLLPSFAQQFNIDFFRRLKLNHKAIELQKELGFGKNLILLLGVSGGGRDTVLEECLELINKSERIRRISTRQPRNGIKEGERMMFLVKKDFLEGFETKNIFFAGHYHVNNEFYGINCKEIRKIKNKKNIYFIENTLIGLSLKKAFPKSRLIILIPPSFKFLKKGF